MDQGVRIIQEFKVRIGMDQEPREPRSCVGPGMDQCGILETVHFANA